MKTRLYLLWQEAVIFYIGGMLYCATELLWRGWTHGSMFVLGAICFYTVTSLERYFRISLLGQMAVGALIVTFFEFWCGIIVNRLLHLNVWDYSSVPMNFMGQICLPFTLLWFPLCGIGILSAKYLRHKLFHDPIGKIRWVV